MRIKQGKRIAIWVYTAACFSTFVLLPRNVWSGQDTNSESGSLSWTRVPDDHVIPTLELLAAQADGNVQRIQTWKGTYNSKVRERVPTTTLPVKFAKKLAVSNTKTVWIKAESDIMFVVDFANDRLFNSKRTRSFGYFEETTGKPVLGELRPVDENIAFTSEHFIHFSPDKFWAIIGKGKDGKLRPQRMGMRESAARRRVDSDLNVISLRSLFGFSPGQKFGEELTLLRDALQGKSNQASIEAVKKALGLFQAPGPSGLLYRLDEALKGPRSERSSLHMTAVFSPASGYNPVSWVLETDTDSSSRRPLAKKQWSWEPVEGLFLPRRMTEASFDKDSGALSWERIYELKESTLNPPVDESQFTYKAIGMDDGDYLDDEILHGRYRMVDGKFEKLPDKRTKSADTTVRGFPNTQIMVVVNVAIVGVLMLAWLRSRRRKAA